MTIATATIPNAPDTTPDPLFDLWLPRLSSGYLAETTAWLHWGLPGLQPLAVLGLAVVIAALALWGSTRSSGPWRRLTPAGLAALALLFITFGTPVDLPDQLQLRGSSGAARRDVAILAAGVTRPAVDPQRVRFMPWVQIENRGVDLPAATVRFSIFNAADDRVWTASQDLSWRQYDRRRVPVEWTAEKAPPGEYRVALAIIAADGRTTVARRENIGQFRIER